MDDTVHAMQATNAAYNVYNQRKRAIYGEFNYLLKLHTLTGRIHKAKGITKKR